MMKHFLLRARVRYENLKSSFGRLRQNVAPKSLQHDYISSFNQSNCRFFRVDVTVALVKLKFSCLFDRERSVEN